MGARSIFPAEGQDGSIAASLLRPGTGSLESIARTDRGASGELEHVIRRKPGPRDAPRAEVSRGHDAEITVEPGDPDSEPHPDGMDGPAPGEQQALVGFEVRPPQQSSAPLDPRLGDLNSPRVSVCGGENDLAHLRDRSRRGRH